VQRDDHTSASSRARENAEHREGPYWHAPEEFARGVALRRQKASRTSRFSSREQLWYTLSFMVQRYPSTTQGDPTPRKLLNGWPRDEAQRLSGADALGQHASAEVSQAEREEAGAERDQHRIDDVECMCGTLVKEARIPSFT